MGRAAGFLLVLGGLVLSLWTGYRHLATPRAEAERTPMAQGEGAQATSALTSAGGQLNFVKHEVGTYDGPDMKNWKHVVLIRADDQHYCIEWVGPSGKLYAKTEATAPYLGRCS